MLDDRLALGQRREHAQHRDEIRDGPRVDRHAAQRPAPHRDRTFFRYHIRAHFAQNVQHRAVALCRLEVQSLHTDARFAQRAHREEKCRVRPVALDVHALRQIVHLSAGDGIVPAGFFEVDARHAEHLLRHRDVGRGLHIAGHPQHRIGRHSRQRRQQARDILRRDIPRNFEQFPGQFPAANEQIARFFDFHAVFAEDRPQRLQWPLRQSPLHVEHRVRAKDANDREQEPQC